MHSWSGVRHYVRTFRLAPDGEPEPMSTVQYTSEVTAAKIARAISSSVDGVVALSIAVTKDVEITILAAYGEVPDKVSDFDWAAPCIELGLPRGARARQKKGMVQ